MNRSASIAIATLFWLCITSTTAVAADCDRECLANVVTQYLEALVEHSPAKHAAVGLVEIHRKHGIEAAG